MSSLHFQLECATISARPGPWILEDPQAFWVLPAEPTTGACAVDTMAVYRLFDSPEHYLTTSLDKRQRLLNPAYGVPAVPEGYGSLGVAFCAPRS